MVVVDVLCHRAPEVPLPYRNDPIETLILNRADKSNIGGESHPSALTEPDGRRSPPARGVRASQSERIALSAAPRDRSQGELLSRTGLRRRPSCGTLRAPRLARALSRPGDSRSPVGQAVNSGTARYDAEP